MCLRLNILILTLLSWGIPSEAANCTGQNDTTCADGLIFPAWTPTPAPTTGDMVCRAIVYLLVLLYLFLGTSIIADKFMEAIEVITSKEKEVKVRKVTGEEHTVLVRVWNETVSNLSLMALGSSAPEILLSVIEIVGKDFTAGELGPGTIVGSAAFNLFIIIAICVVVIPTGEVRRIKHVVVFWVTAVWSIFAYIWLYLILAVFSEGRVELWEALLTFAFFPACVLTAYVADRQMFGIFGKRYKGGSGRAFSRPGTAGSGHKLDDKTNGSSPLTKDNVELGSMNSHGQEVAIMQPTLTPEEKAYEQQRAEYISIFKELRAKHPDAPIEILEQIAEQEMLKRAPKSRAFYRIKASRQMTGAGNVVAKKMHQIDEEKKRITEQLSRVGSPVDGEPGFVTCNFDPGHYTCMEDVGTVYTTVVCHRGGVDTPCTLMVDYRTEEGTASAVADFIPTQGTLTFHPDESRKHIGVEIVDNDMYEEDEEFSIVLFNVRASPTSSSNAHNNIPTKIATPSIATVLIVDNDHGGAFVFTDEKVDVIESAGDYEIKVMRTRGARGDVRVPYKTIDGSAKAGRDYYPTEGVLEFKDEQTEAVITIGIVNDDQYEKSEDFYVVLDQPIFEESYYVTGDSAKEREVAELGKPILGPISRCKIVIKESTEFKSFVDKMLTTTGHSIVVGTSSWKQQFKDAVSVQAGGDDDDSEAPPSCFDYVMHAITVPWKVLFAIVPPTDYVNGWLSFVVSIAFIGVITAFISDLASHFGCTVGLKSSINAISIVALGTSLPDTFASKSAALNDDCADSSIVNVTGSNAVNVFLGLGVAWLIAAIVHEVRGTKNGFEVPAGSLAFSVTIFCIGAVICVALLQVRRYVKPVGGELGGPKGMKIITFTVFIGTWLVYLILSTMEAYCFITPF